jgi:hypothetical protein
MFLLEALWLDPKLQGRDLPVLNNYLTCSKHIQINFLFRWNIIIIYEIHFGMELILLSLQGLTKSIALWMNKFSRNYKNTLKVTLLFCYLETNNFSFLLELINFNNCHWESEKFGWL